jgi:TolB-like protein/tetratricopeptide (TPR) repeat protein
MTASFDDNEERFVEELVQRFVDAQLDGRRLDVDEYVRARPALERQIRRKIANVCKIEELFGTLVQAEATDFGAAGTSTIRVGEQVGHFKLTEMIGRGGMGVVYLAHDTKLHRSVAVKAMPAELAANSVMQTRFQREARLLASLNHPNIAAIHEVVEEAGGIYLVLEYIRGDTLAKRISHKPLEWSEALRIGQQIAEALSAAHRQGVVHRDLKPGNIKITPEGRVKVLDFGLAQGSIRLSRNGQSTTTQAGHIVGTPAYMSPEQAQGREVDRPTDTWSFGCVLYEMLTGRSPFEGKTATDTLARVIEREPDWELLADDIPSNVRDLLHRCLEKDPARRLEDMEDAAAEIGEAQSCPAPLRTEALHKTARTPVLIVGAAIIAALSGMILWIALPLRAPPSPGVIRLAVLPFANLGPGEDEYFADGITDAIMARLTGIHGLGVISRQSAIQYKDSGKRIQDIARELRVEYILTGTVRREQPSDPNGSVRITPELIRASDDTQVWAQPYNTGMGEIFQIQLNVVVGVARVLGITLREQERQALQRQPTVSMEAYNYYLLGNQYMYRSYLESDYRIAIRMYDNAIELDSAFALAYAQLSRAYVYMHWHHPYKAENSLLKAKQAVDKALALAPHVPEVHLALGQYHYHAHLQYEDALRHLEIARKDRPTDSQIVRFIAYVYRRQGKFPQAVNLIKEAMELDPRFATLPYVIGETLLLMREYEEAKVYLDRAISLAPDWPRPYAWKMQLHLLWDGDKQKARRTLEQALNNAGLRAREDAFVTLWSVRLDMFEERYAEALDRLSVWESEAFETQFYLIPKAQVSAQIHGLMSNDALEQTDYDAARRLLEAAIQEHPEDGRAHSSLGVVYAGLGREQDAVREGQSGVASLPVTKEAYRGTFRVDNLARIYVMVGDFDSAIDTLGSLLSRPSELTRSSLQLDPAWAPLRNDARFKQLLESAR